MVIAEFSLSFGQILGKVNFLNVMVLQSVPVQVYTVQCLQHVKYQLVLMGMLKGNQMIQRPPQSTTEKLPAVYGSCSTLQRGERFCLAGCFKNKPKSGDWGGGGGCFGSGVRESKEVKLVL